jgi:hypothetical protein
MLKRIHINQHVIKQNAKNGDRNPVITCKTYKSNNYFTDLEIMDSDGSVAAKVIYRPDEPDCLPCGAKVWIETKAEVKGV